LNYARGTMATQQRPRRSCYGGERKCVIVAKQCGKV
jgi:hypothetical protein